MFDRFFRNRAINAFLAKKKNGVLPDISKYPVIALLMDETQYVKVKELETVLNKLFVPKKICFFVIYNELPKDFKIDGKANVISRGDFNIFGRLKKNVQFELTSTSFDMMVNLSGGNSELLMEEYIMAVLKASFRVSFGNSCGSLYDFVIDSKQDGLVGKIETLHKYLVMLLGKKYEK